MANHSAVAEPRLLAEMIRKAILRYQSTSYSEASLCSLAISLFNVCEAGEGVGFLRGDGQLLQTIVRIIRVEALSQPDCIQAMWVLLRTIIGQACQGTDDMETDGRTSDGQILRVLKQEEKAISAVLSTIAEVVPGSDIDALRDQIRRATTTTK